MSIRIQVHNYRVLRNLEWSLPEGICVLVGPNGSGKTTLLTIPAFLRNVYLRGVSSAIGHLGGSWGLRNWAAGSDEPVSIALGVDEITWELQLSVRAPSVDERAGERLTRGEEVWLFREPFSDHLVYRGHDWPIPPNNGSRTENRVGLRKVFDDRADDELEGFVGTLTGSRAYSLYDLRKLTTFGSLYDTDLYLHPSGENVFTVLRNWRDRRDCRHRFDFVLESLRDAFPDICADVDFETAGQTVTAKLISPGVGEPVPLRFAPNGWLMALLHLSAVAGAKPGTLVAIDEVENALHPFAIRRLIAAFRDWARASNLTIILATHSPVTIDEFKEDPARVFIMEPGASPLPVKLTNEFATEWLAHFSLGELFAHESFGGPGADR